MSESPVTTHNPKGADSTEGPTAQQQKQMDIEFLDILTILGALAFFIFGMKMMSDGIQKAAGGSLKRILGAMTKNNFLGVVSGFMIWILIMVQVNQQENGVI